MARDVHHPAIFARVTGFANARVRSMCVDALPVYAGRGGRTFLDVFGARGPRESRSTSAFVRIIFGSAFGSVLARSRSTMILQFAIRSCESGGAVTAMFFDVVQPTRATVLTRFRVARVRYGYLAQGRGESQRTVAREAWLRVR